MTLSGKRHDDVLFIKSYTPRELAEGQATESASRRAHHQILETYRKEESRYSRRVRSRGSSLVLHLPKTINIFDSVRDGVCRQERVKTVASGRMQIALLHPPTRPTQLRLTTHVECLRRSNSSNSWWNAEFSSHGLACDALASPAFFSLCTSGP